MKKLYMKSGSSGFFRYELRVMAKFFFNCRFIAIQYIPLPSQNTITETLRAESFLAVEKLLVFRPCFSFCLGREATTDETRSRLLFSREPRNLIILNVTVLRCVDILHSCNTPSFGTTPQTPSPLSYTRDLTYNCRRSTLSGYCFTGNRKIRCFALFTCFQILYKI